MDRCDSCRYQNDFEFHACHICHMERDMYRPKETNADRIRSMTDEELADWVWGAESAGRAYGPRGKKAWLDWLKQEAEEASDEQMR